jgi:hypothetical protein
VIRKKLGAAGTEQAGGLQAAASKIFLKMYHAKSDLRTTIFLILTISKRKSDFT